MVVLYRKRGFTLVELLVVIAIIGLLVTIAMANINTAHNKAKNSAIKENLSSLRIAAELYCSRNNDIYTGFCSGDDAIRIKNAVESQAPSGETMTCNADTDEYCGQIKLHGTINIWWCTDYKKVSGEFSAAQCSGIDGDIDCD